MSDPLYIAYDNTEFIYFDLKSNNAPFYPKEEECSDLKDKEISCDSTEKFTDNSFNCLKREICTNKNLAESLELEYINKGEIQNYNDYKYSYYNYILNSLNLSIGIIAIISLIIYEKYKHS